MAIIDSNHKTPHQIRWDTCHWPESDTENSLWTELDNNYTFHATSPITDSPPSGRGIILLSHNRCSFGKIHNSRRHTPFPRFRKDKETEYAEGVASLLVETPPSPISFTEACITTHLALASSPRYTKQFPPETHSLYTRRTNF